MAEEQTVVEEKTSDRKALSFYKEAVAELSPEGVRATHYRLKDWQPIHTKILVLVQKGMTPSQICEEAEIGYTANQIKRIIKDPLFRFKLTQYNKKMDVAIIDRATEEMTRFPEVELAKNRLAESAEKAARVLLDMMNPKSRLYKTLTIHERRLMLSVAQDVLDRSGLKNVIPEEANRQTRDYSPEEIKSALDNAKELEAIAGRLDGRDSSYVLTREQRHDIEPTPAPETPDETEGSIEIQTPAFEETIEGEIVGEPPLENKE